MIDEPAAQLVEQLQLNAWLQFVWQPRDLLVTEAGSESGD